MDNTHYDSEKALHILKMTNQNLFHMNIYTDNILMCSYDEIEENIEKRNVCFENVKNYDKELKKMRSLNAIFDGIMSLNIEFEKLNDKEKELYNERCTMKRVIDEILSKDDILTQKVIECKDAMLERIKNLNSGNEAKASKFHAYTSYKNSGDLYIPKKNKQI